MFLLCVCVYVHWASLVYVFAMCSLGYSGVGVCYVFAWMCTWVVWCMFLLCVCVNVHWASLVYVFAICLCGCALG